MRITVFGAAGNTGGRVVAEALARGHQVTAVVRDPARFAELPKGAHPRVGDATDPADGLRLVAGQDLVITATRPAPGAEEQLAVAATTLLASAATTGVRLLAVGGAGSLTVPGRPAMLTVDDPQWVPAAWRDIALACNAQYARFTAESGADWTYLSPPAQLAPGVRTGHYRTGGDELLVAADGTSAISMEDLAVALLDEAERPRHRCRRFTVAY